jgi:hypothetical protein
VLVADSRCSVLGASSFVDVSCCPLSRRIYRPVSPKRPKIIPWVFFLGPRFVADTEDVISASASTPITNAHHRVVDHALSYCDSCGSAAADTRDIDSR